MEDNTVPTEWIAATFAAPRDRLTVRNGGTKKHRPKARTVAPGPAVPVTVLIPTPPSR